MQEATLLKPRDQGVMVWVWFAPKVFVCFNLGPGSSTAILRTIRGESKSKVLRFLEECSKNVLV